MSDATLPADAVPRAAASADGRPVVLVVSSYTRSLTNFRYELLCAMAAVGHRVVATGPEDDAGTIARLAAAGIGFVRIPLARTGLSPLGDLAYLARLVLLVRRLRPAAVVPYTAKPVIWGGIAARLNRRPLYPLMTGLGYAFAHGERPLKARLVRALTVRLYRAALRTAGRAFVYNAADEADILRHRMVPCAARLSRVAGSGVNLAQFAASPVPTDPVAFVLIARLLRDKGIAEYVAAARVVKARHPGVRFRLVGPRDPNPDAFTDAELADATADGTVEYCGATADVRPYLAEASAFVLPSYYREGVPRTILEALATGRAVITTDLPGCADTVEDGANGFLVPPRDPAALATAMMRIVEDPARAVAMGVRSRELAAARWDVHAVNRQLLAEMGLAAA